MIGHATKSGRDGYRKVVTRVVVEEEMVFSQEVEKGKSFRAGETSGDDKQFIRLATSDASISNCRIVI
jgi:hypothetical protein